MITVSTEAVTEPITLTQAKDWLNITGTAHDDKITAGIKAARKKVEQLSGRSIAAKTYTLTLHGYTGEYIDLPYPDVNQITSVTVYDTAGEDEVLTTDAVLVASRLHLLGDGRTLVIVYTTKANTEEFYKLAIKKQLAYDYRNEFTENGFDKEVITMLSTETLNLGY